MAGGLVGLLDDIAALAKLAAASIDDVGAAAGPRKRQGRWGGCRRHRGNASVCARSRG